jgi:hypothetical protein
MGDAEEGFPVFSSRGFASLLRTSCRMSAFEDGFLFACWSAFMIISYRNPEKTNWPPDRSLQSRVEDRPGASDRRQRTLTWAIILDIKTRRQELSVQSAGIFWKHFQAVSVNFQPEMPNFFLT